MEIFVYKKDADSIEEGFSVKHLPELLADKTNVVWVDFETNEPDELQGSGKHSARRFSSFII